MQELQIVGCTLIKGQQFMNINLGTMDNPQTIKVNAQLVQKNMNLLKKLLMEYKDIFAWMYKDLKGIPLELARHYIELNTFIPLRHQVRYKMNPIYVVDIKQNR